eukprot:8489503-Heterocapsa_arctica.AAC.1
MCASRRRRARAAAGSVGAPAAGEVDAWMVRLGAACAVAGAGAGAVDTPAACSDCWSSSCGSGCWLSRWKCHGALESVAAAVL